MYCQVTTCKAILPACAGFQLVLQAHKQELSQGWTIEATEYHKQLNRHNQESLER